MDRLIEGMAKAGRPVSRADLDYLVENNDKGRFSFDSTGARIRAHQGHSVEVDLQLSPQDPPDVLFHGTHGGALGTISSEGLRKMERHAVHLSADATTASKVGGRRGKPVILEVDAKGMAENGYLFYRSDNGVWLTEHVPCAYIKFPDG